MKCGMRPGRRHARLRFDGFFGMLLTAIISLSLAPAVQAGEIHDAVQAGDAPKVAALLRADPSLVRAQSENPTRDFPLHTAATAGAVETARLLLDSGADLECQDRDGSTPLHDAALARKPEMVRFLLERGADVNRRDRNGAYALSFAAAGGDSACVRLVLDAGADLNFTSPEGTTLLHFACSRGLWFLTERVIAEGGDINRGNREGITPLHFASMGQFPDRVERIIALGANVAVPDSDGMSPLHMAAANDRAENVRILLEHGADANVVDKRGTTPLAFAGRGGTPLVRLLLEHGGDPNARNEWGLTPLRAAVEGGNAESVDLLLRAGADPAAAEPDLGLTPLHLAALFGYADIALRLLSAGAPMDARDLEGRTPLDLALKGGQSRIAEALAAGGSSRPGPFVIPKPGAAEAYVWSLGHSAWAVKTRHHLLVFDAGMSQRNPDEPSLRSGSVNPAEIAGENVTVFASHEHGDHYDPAVFGWKERVPRIRYILGFRPGTLPMPGRPAGAPVPESAYEYMPGGETRTMDGMKITTIESNDSGVGFLVEADGVTIFHAGDHANRNRDLSGPFKPQIDALASRSVRPDLAFLPVRGCNFGDQVAVKIGVEYQLEKLQPRVFFPMHSGLYGTDLREFVTALGDAWPATRKVAVLEKGDSFHYSNGRIL